MRRLLQIAAIGILIALVIAPSPSFGQDSLAGLRDDVRTDDSPVEDAPCNPRDNDSPHWHDDDPGDDSMLLELTAWILSSPFWAPHKILNDNYAHHSEFLSYPYKRDWQGNMQIEDSTHIAKWWHIRARGEYAHDLDRLSRTGGHILFDTAWRLGFDTSFDHRQEEITAAREDQLWTGDMNILFRFAQSEFLQMRTGAGANWLADDIRSDWGFNFTYGGDLMPLQPFILSAEIDWGRLGHSELFHGRATVGVEYRHVELYTGFDYFDVGETQIRGWIAGTRLWF
jgi:hypothetical protein